jgi:hypothetical protein
MPRGARDNTQRRHRLYQNIRRYSLVMRACQRYTSQGLECRKSPSSDKYNECVRVSHPCSLVVTL